MVTQENPAREARRIFPELYFNSERKYAGISGTHCVESVADWRHGGKAWRHSGKAWRHGGIAAWRQSVAAWRHGGINASGGTVGGKAWRHGGKAGGINASGGKAWRHGGMAAKPKPWRQSRQCQQSCSHADQFSQSVHCCQQFSSVQFSSVQFSSVSVQLSSVQFQFQLLPAIQWMDGLTGRSAGSFAEMPEPPWRHGGKTGGKAGGKAGGIAAKRWRQSKAGRRQSVAAWRQSVAGWRHGGMAAKRGGMAAKRGGMAA
eukprot:gene15399-biopygen8788